THPPPSLAIPRSRATAECLSRSRRVKQKSRLAGSHRGVLHATWLVTRNSRRVLGTTYRQQRASLHDRSPKANCSLFDPAAPGSPRAYSDGTTPTRPGNTRCLGASLWHYAPLAVGGAGPTSDVMTTFEGYRSCKPNSRLR